MSQTATSASALTAEPLYARVRAALTQRLISGDWPPGSMLPSEQKIAAELGVSQGTVRKALDAMASEGLLMRKQGRGTFVAEAEDRDILFKFYRLTPREETRDLGQFPQSRNLKLDHVDGDEDVRRALSLVTKEKLWRLERIRLVDDRPILWEEIHLPEARFPNLTRHAPLPNNLYKLFSETFNVTVASVNEKLSARAASGSIAEHLELPSGSPLLFIERQSTALDGQIVEVRRSFCNTETMTYRSEL